MDAPDVDPAELRRSLAFIRRVNRFLGYNRATLGHLKRFSRRWGPAEKIRILDLATGSADLPREILRWVDRVNRRRGWQWDVRVIGVDLHSETLAAAGRETTNAGTGSRIQLVQADVLALPFAEGSFDYAITSMFLHHLAEDEAVRVLTAMGRVARRGIIAADLLRHRRALAWIWLFTLFSGRMVRHDARVSVRQAFDKDEVLKMRDTAGIGFARYFRHFGHRFVLAGERIEGERTVNTEGRPLSITADGRTRKFGRTLPLSLASPTGPPSPSRQDAKDKKSPYYSERVTA